MITDNKEKNLELELTTASGISDIKNYIEPFPAPILQRGSHI